ncbi:hypothetical protein Q7530_11520, partial [Glaesserella parasuis]|nr:hypothetical protein [Glaesserella parasuis]
ATGKDEQSNVAQAPELTVKADATPESAEAAKVTTEGDKVVSEPGGDSKTQTVNEVDADGIETPIVVAEKDEDGTWKLADNDPNKANTSAVTDNGSTITINKGDGKTITIDKNTGKITIDPGVVSDGKSISTETADASGNTTSSGEPIVPPEKEESRETADQPIITLLDNGENKGGVQIQPGDDNTTFTVSYVKEPETADGNTNTDAATRAQDLTLTAVKDKQTGIWSLSKDSQGKDIPSDIAEIDPTSGTITLKAKAVMDGSTVKATGTDILNNSVEAEQKQAPNNPDVVAPEAQPQPPTVEPEPETPPAPAQPELQPVPETKPTDKLDSPTEFINKGFGSVEIKPGQNVDFISFTVETVDGKQNIAFIKDDKGGWEKYEMNLGDANNNDIIDGNETVEYRPADGVALQGGKFTVNGITSTHITNILVGKEGDEFLKPVEDTVATDNFDVSGAGHKVHSFAVKQDNNVAVPEKMHVLSNGEELVAPIIQPEKIEGTNLYRVKITADPNKIDEIGFGINAHDINNNAFVLKSTAGHENSRWQGAPAYTNGETNNIYVVPSDNDPNVVYIWDRNPNDGNSLKVNVNPNGSENWIANNVVESIRYTSKPGNTATRMDDLYTGTEAGNPWGSPKALELTDVKITERYQDVPADSTSGSTGTPSTGESGGTSGGNSGTSSGSGTAAPTTPTPKEEYDTPTATVDSHNKGGVIVSPRSESENSGQPKTKHFRVDYQQPDGTNKSIWFKYGENNQWALDSSKHNEQNGISVDTNNNGNGLIKLDPQSGKVTFAPSAVKDGSEVYISALAPDGTTARRQEKVKAEVEPQPVKPTAQHDTEHRGGVIVQPQTNTNKFKLTYIDEQNKRRELTYEKDSNTQKWKLSDSDATKLNGVSENLKPKLNDTDGKITLAPDAVRDNSQVKIESYNNEDRITQSADVTTTTDKV